MKFIAIIVILTTCFHTALARATQLANPFHGLIQKGRTISWNSTRTQSALSGSTIDLGYGIYQGVYNSTWDLNTFKGIRYAAPPTGSLRWQLPQTPLVDRSHVIQASKLPSQCPQGFKASGLSSAANAAFIDLLGPASEDCLFLNVYSPANATNLPVLVYIHGGGYGYGNANQDLSSIIAANDNGFIGVGIQYRLGAFGFLASDEVKTFGVTNVGLRDQQFALQWIQSYIHMFGGNAAQVTIAGESAGAGSVMLQSMAFGGELGESLFSNVIAASPYLPAQHEYNAWTPSQAYYTLAERVGCFPGVGLRSSTHFSSVFECLVHADSAVLMEANAVVSASGVYGSWAFAPVTDGTFIQQLPSQQLHQNRVNGARILAGNNANEGPDFVPQNITTESDVISWIQSSFPMLTSNDVSKILLNYPSTGSEVTEAAAALNAAEPSPNDAAVQQQRANDIFAETTIVCPSYWLTEAYSSGHRQAFKYQYSIEPALHGTDFNGYFGPQVPYLSTEFMSYFQRIWGNFIMHNNPSVDSAEGRVNDEVEAVSAWPAFSDGNPIQVNLNQTGGELVTDLNAFPLVSYGEFLNSTYYINPGLEPRFSLVNAYTWENGRGYRCDFWRSISSVVPE